MAAIARFLLSFRPIQSPRMLSTHFILGVVRARRVLLPPSACVIFAPRSGLEWNKRHSHVSLSPH